MKTFRRIAVMAVMVILCAFAFAGCAVKTPVYFDKLVGETLTSVVVDADKFEADATVKQAMESKKYTKKINAEFDLTNPKLPFLVKAFGLEYNDEKQEFIAIYVTDELLSYEGAPTKEVNGVKYYSAGVGVNEIVLTSGLRVLFTIEKW